MNNQNYAKTSLRYALTQLDKDAARKQAELQKSAELLRSKMATLLEDLEAGTPPLWSSDEVQALGSEVDRLTSELSIYRKIMRQLPLLFDEAQIISELYSD